LRTRAGEERLVSWSSTVLRENDERVGHIIATGIDITESKRLEKAMLDVSEREQRRIGHDLHDGLGQHLTGIAFLSKALEQALEDQSLPAANDAAKLVMLVNEAIQLTRDLSKGLQPVVPEARGLMTALERLVLEVEDLFSISCAFRCPEPVLVNDQAMATHLYHIAQESVTKAIRHGRARNVEIRLTTGIREGVLRVADDGTGIADKSPKGPGMGLHIMKHRAGLIGAVLLIERGPKGGTLVTCSFPLKAKG
jgi:signal transduction histidine kinase